MPGGRRMLLADAAARVRDTGVGETFDFESGLFANRRLQAPFAPFDRGVALFPDDMSLTDDLAAARTSADALAALWESSGRVATGRLSARGLIDTAPAPLVPRARVSWELFRGVPHRKGDWQVKRGTVGEGVRGGD